MTKNSYLSIYLCVSLGAISFGVLLSAFWLLYPYQPFTFYDPLIPTIKQVYHPGETVTWHTHFKHNTEGVLIQVDRHLVDGIVINYPTVSYVSDGKEQDFVNATMKLPDFISPGKYHFQIISTVKVNPIRDIIVVRETEEFTVIK